MVLRRRRAAFWREIIEAEHHPIKVKQWGGTSPLLEPPPFRCPIVREGRFLKVDCLLICSIVGKDKDSSPIRRPGSPSPDQVVFLKGGWRHKALPFNSSNYYNA